MGWDFQTDPDYQLELDWVERFVDEEIAPVDLVIEHAWDVRDPVRNALIKPLQEKVRIERGALLADHHPTAGERDQGKPRIEPHRGAVQARNVTAVLEVLAKRQGPIDHALQEPLPNREDRVRLRNERAQLSPSRINAQAGDLARPLALTGCVQRPGRSLLLVEDVPAGGRRES